MRSITQTVFPFKLEEIEKDSNLTSTSGLALIYELFHKLKIPGLIQKHVKVKEAGWSEWELIESVIGLVVSGGDHMDDMEMLLSDEAFQALVRKKVGRRKDEKACEKEISKNEQKALPSAKAIERFLKRFDSGEVKPEGIDAWVPKESKGLQGLAKVNRDLVKKLIELSDLKTVTIENDATAVFSHKEESFGTYKGGTGYMPVLGTVSELGLIIADEFRDGNVPPAFEVERFFKECEKAIPDTVKTIRTRLDGAYYDHEFIKHLNHEAKRFGRIEFTITMKKSTSLITWIEAIPEKEWKPLHKLTEYGEIETDKEWAELPWTSAAGTRKTMKERLLRTIVTRKKQKQWELFKEDRADEWDEKDRYGVIGTNRDRPGDELIRWHNKKAGGIEHVNDRIKNDLAGGVLPCGEFGANAAWWRIQCMAWNLVRALQLHALPDDLKSCHLKRLRYKLICIAGKVVRKGRQLILRLKHGHPSFQIYKEARLAIANLAIP